MTRAMSSGRMSSRKASAAVAARRPEPSPPLEPVTVQPSEEFTEAVCRELRRLEEAKRSARRLPEHTLYRELASHLSSALNALYKQGRIRVGDTINDKYISTATTNSNQE